MKKTMRMMKTSCILASLAIIFCGLSTERLFADMLYTQTNPAGPNAIAAFQQNIKTGHLELKALYPTGGIGNPNFAGCSQDTMVSDGEFLYNVNIGSNDISVFRIKGDGSLEQVGNPVPSGGLVPITLAVTHGLLYVGNQGDATTVPANYTGFAIHDGKLTPIPGSTVTLDVTLPGLPGPADLQFTQNSKLLMGTRVSANTVDIFRVTERGLLERTDQLTAPHPFGIGFNPTARGQAIISLEALPGSSSFRIFSNGHGALLHEALDQAAVDSCWVQIRKDGELVWLSGFFGQSITLHRLDENGVLQPLSLHDTSSFGLFASDILLDGRQRFLYEVLPGSGQLHVMHVTGDTANGGLADVETITLPANSFPAGLIIASTSADGQ